MKVVLLSDTFYTLFAYQQFIKSLPDDAQASVLTWSPGFARSAHLMNCFNEVRLLNNWPRGLSKLNPFHKTRHKFKLQFEEFLKENNPDLFIVHQIYDSKLNYSVQLIKSKFPNARVSLLPDGTFNMSLVKLSLRQRLGQFIKSLIGKMNGFRYMPFYGDKTGIDSDLIDSIFLPRNFYNEYNQNKVSYFNTSLTHSDDKLNHNQFKTAIFVDQPLVEHNYCSKDTHKKFLEFIDNDLRSRGVKEVVYRPHPRNKNPKIPDSWSNLKFDGDLIDNHVIQKKYDYVCSFSSSVLLSVSFNSDKNKKFISYDIIDYMKHNTKVYRALFLQMEKIGCIRKVVLIDETI